MRQRKASGFDEDMSPQEKRTAMSLAGIYSVRMLGLFMVLPVFTLYGAELKGHTDFLIGLAIGIYGLTQAILQIPFGMLSDRIGRKPVILAGLVIFIIGSVIAAMSHTIYGVIFGRALQGAGAISSTVMALAADLTRDEHRTKIMGSIGLSIGIAFSVALVAGPILNRWIGVDGIFWVTAALGLVAIAIALWVVPTPRAHKFHRDTEVVADAFGAVLRDGQLLRLDLGIFMMQFVLTANFVVLPLVLTRLTGIARGDSWELYLPVMLIAFVLMVPLIIIAEKRRKMKSMFLGAIAVLGLSEILYLFSDRSLAEMIATLLIFFTAFNLLEASLPSLVAKMAPSTRKGTAMGVYSTSQFLGIFAGGAIGGAVYGRWGFDGVFLLGAFGVGVWLLLASSMKSPRYLSSYVLQLEDAAVREEASTTAALARVPGVAEVMVVAEEGVAYLKVDRNALDESRLREFSPAST
ncbi:MFS transporter [Acidihalobacter prosperus]|uniref:Transport protein n=1 Tax=Acidihalobacter prosperus TaxID=160660 RepID=A0A1A6C640_9GAMM|nr:MFS transporter [Acidihalobacter prosperus]OBS10005.1 putative transport protein [Acidihalobacter prosperus]